MEAEGADIIRRYDYENKGALSREQLDNLLSGPDVPHSKGRTADDLMHFFDKNKKNVDRVGCQVDITNPTLP